MNFLLRSTAAVLLVTAMISCNNDKEDVTNSVNKAGSVESSVTVQHVDSTHDVLTTTHKVWADYKEYKTIVYNDTIPALGHELATAENKDGDTKQVNVKKDYEIFITVK